MKFQHSAYKFNMDFCTLSHSLANNNNSDFSDSYIF